MKVTGNWLYMRLNFIVSRMTVSSNVTNGLTFCLVAKQSAVL